MLVIRRKEGQAIRVGDTIRIEVLESSPNRVKLGIIAPADVRIVREEVLLAEAENREASTAAPPDVLARWAHHLRLPGRQPD
jgi:carbon storage regulator